MPDRDMDISGEAEAQRVLHRATQRKVLRNIAYVGVGLALIIGVTAPLGDSEPTDSATPSTQPTTPDVDLPPDVNPELIEPGIGADGDRPVDDLAEPSETRRSGTTSRRNAGIPVNVLAAYQRAAELMAQSQRECHLPVSLLAAIGKVESNHANSGSLDASGRTVTAILGPLLNGLNETAAIRDTDQGQLDSHSVWDRAVGPMQFIPTTWARWAADGNSDRARDPHNVYDASLAAARYLCAHERDLNNDASLNAAIYSYNHSDAYVQLVRDWMDAYANVGGVTQLGLNRNRNRSTGSEPGSPPSNGSNGSNGSSGSAQALTSRPAPGSSRSGRSPSRQPGNGQNPGSPPSEPGQPAPDEPTPDEPGSPAQDLVDTALCTTDDIVEVGTDALDGLLAGLIGPLPDPSLCNDSAAAGTPFGTAPDSSASAGPTTSDTSTNDGGLLGPLTGLFGG